MHPSGKLNDELQALKADVARILNIDSRSPGHAGARADDLSEQLKAALDELGSVLSEKEEHVGKILAEHPVTSVASAFALGVVLGFMMRRA